MRARSAILLGLLFAGALAPTKTFAQDNPADTAPPATTAPAPWVYDPDRHPPPAPLEERPDPTLSSQTAESRDAAARAKEHRQLAAARETAKDLGLGFAIGGTVTFVLGYAGSIVTGLVANGRCSDCRSVTEWIWIPFANAFTAHGISDDDAASWGTIAGLFTAQLLGAAFGAAGAWMHANPEQFFPRAVSVGPDGVKAVWAF